MGNGNCGLGVKGRGDGMREGDSEGTKGIKGVKMKMVDDLFLN